MKSFCILLTAVCVMSIALAEESSPLKNENDKVSYSIGLDIGQTFKRQQMDLNMDALMRGMKDAVGGAKPLLTEAEVKETMSNYQKEMMEKQATANKEQAAKNQAEGEKFLAENKSKPGVKTTASGLQYKVITEGKGESPKETDSVVTNYRGTLIDGKEFDSSYKRGQPATFPVNRVIKGWTEALQMMKPGAKYQLFIPANLAYGERGAGQDIGPNSTLIFEVELVSVEPPKNPAAASPAVAKPAGAPGGTPAPSAKPSASAK